MNETEKLNQLVSRWQELRKQGRELSVKDLCQAQPHLAPLISDRIHAILEAEKLPSQVLPVGDHVSAQTPDPFGTVDYVPHQQPAPVSSLPTGDFSHPSTPHGKDKPTPGPTVDYTPAGVEGSPLAQSSTGDFQPQEGDTQLENLPQDLSDGRYEIFAELGRGGFGAVYRALDKRTGQHVALKTMKRHDSTSLEYFKGEFRYLQGVSHRNLVQLYELESDGQSWLLTMEFIDGVDFLRYVRPQGRLDISKLRKALGQLVEGIAALHSYRRIHRDIKPANVRVSPEGRVVVLDFGLAAELSPGGEYEAERLEGTIYYMAPEQGANPPVVSPASDWYAAGVMLFQSLTGRFPFTGRTITEVLRDKRTCEPAAPQEFEPSVPEDLNDLCMALLARLPGDRPKAAEILQRMGRTPEETRESHFPTQVPFLGRDRHLRVLQEAYAECQQGQTVMVSVQGPSGIGKSALIHHFMDQLRDQAVVVLAGRCYEHELVPYKAIDPIIDELARYLRRLDDSEVQDLLPEEVGSCVRVFPVLKRINAVAEKAKRSLISPDLQEVKRRAFVGLRDLLRNLSERRPLVLSIDDLQWGDIDSATLLADLIQPPDAPRMLLLTSHRIEDANSPCLRTVAQALERVGAVNRRELAVDSLTEKETGELVTRMLGSEAVDQVSAIARESAGNPFFITELVEAIQAGFHESTEGNVTLDGLIRSRVKRLPTGARRLLVLQREVLLSGAP
ncbi:MAG: serine/threonine protein kinase [Gemmataceae bacterium]